MFKSKTKSGFKKRPIISKSNITLGKVFGVGVEGEVRNATLKEKGRLSISVAIKKLNPFFRSFITKKVLIDNQKVWLDFYKAKLPVPKLHKLDLRKNSPTYENVIMSNLKKDHKILIPVNIGKTPKNLMLIDPKKDRKLIKNLATDFAKIVKLGYSPSVIDFWHFYKKGNTMERVIIDYTSLRKRPKDHNYLVQNALAIIKENMDPSTFQIFNKQFNETMNK
ncbi:MAG: hypothetical protein WC915_05330 [archaeon]|jgi:hypothetical protein